MRHVRWAADECHWQRSGEASVFWMLQGWDYARRRMPGAEPRLMPDGSWHEIGPEHVLALGRLVEPRHNQGGLRTVDVRVGASVKMPWGDVPAALGRWIEDLPCLDPTEAFRQYEEIHPFRDGNGRTGSIIFNLLSGTLDAPVHPPNLWNDPERYEGEVPDA